MCRMIIYEKKKNNIFLWNFFKEKEKEVVNDGEEWISIEVK